MSRFIFAAVSLLALAGPATAQGAPGRDLLDFPLGLLAEAPPLSRQMTGGLWNPASSALAPAVRAGFGFAGLTTPQDQGVNLEMISAVYAVRPTLTASVSFAQAAVNDILSTQTDPQSFGGEIPYSTTVASAGLAATRGNATFGLAARYRWGTADVDHGGALGIDAGAIVDRVGGTPLRLAASTFLFSPSNGSRDASYFAAADVPVVRRDSSLVVRAGYSIARIDGHGHDGYTFATTTYRQFDASVGMARTTVFGNQDQRWRLGFGLHYAGYTVAIGREEGAAGFSSSYQFLLTRVIR